MDFGMATLETAGLLSDFGEKPNNNWKIHGSRLLNQKRSDPAPHDDQEPFLRSSKAARTDPFNKTMSMRSETMLSVPATDGASSNNMLSFSSSSSSSSSTNITENGNQSSFFAFCRQPPAYIGNAGCGSGGGLQAGMHAPVSRYKGPFAPSQWVELEHQALIYKHIMANVPVPSHLLNPIRKSLDPFHFSGSSSSSYVPNSYGWGGFHLGFSGSTDPEPGRCRRTDGKKWRCSKDAVPDHKYCERHINRGRHRSRKLVEGNMGPVVSSSSSSGGGIHNQFKNLQPQNAAINPSTDTHNNRSQDSQKASNMCIKNCNSYLDQDAINENLLHRFMDNRPKDQLDGTSVAWRQEPTTDWTQLSMSMASSDLSSTNSPAQEKLTIAHKQTSNWIPISWQNSMGGPLGEVLKTSSSSGGNSKNSSTPGSSHMTELCCVGSHPSQCSYSPTGVLQKTTSISLSNSSSGNSPRGGNKEDRNGNGGGDEMLLSAHTSSTSFPLSM